MRYFKAAMDEDERNEADRLDREERMERDGEPEEEWLHEPHYHWHEGEGHEHVHNVGHHGPAFGKTQVYEVEEPSLELLLHHSIEAEEAKRGND